MAAYGVFAEFYDSFTENVDYEKRADYILSLFEAYGKKPSLLLDAACGTASLTVCLAEEIPEIIGVDGSPDMLCEASQKAADNGSNIMFVCQDLCELDLYGRVDGAVCTLDSVNHLESLNSVERFFERVSLFLEENSLFIFDVNTVYKHREILGDNSFVFENDDVLLAWQNGYEPTDNTVDIKLDFFKKTDTKPFDGNYMRYTECFTERAYETDEIKQALLKSGMKCLAVLDDMTTNEINDKTERAVFVARKGI